MNIFNELINIDHITGKIYRLYNSALGRFPDIDGFKYWIDKNNSGENTYYQISSSFIDSSEFKELCFATDSDQKYLTSLYKNAFNREPDKIGYNYWIKQLEGGHESRSEVLIGFAESQESKAIFSNETGLVY